MISWHLLSVAQLAARIWNQIKKIELRDGPEQPLNSSIDYYSFSIDLLIDYSMFCGLNESCNLIQILFTIAFVVDLWWLGSLDSEAPGTWKYRKLPGMIWVLSRGFLYYSPTLIGTSTSRYTEILQSTPPIRRHITESLCNISGVPRYYWHQFS